MKLSSCCRVFKIAQFFQETFLSTFPSVFWILSSTSIFLLLSRRFSFQVNTSCWKSPPLNRRFLSFFPKKWQNFFNKFYYLEMKICAKEARRLKSNIELRRLMEKIEKRFWTSWRSTKSTDIWRNGVGLVGLAGRRISRLGKSLKWKIYYFIVFLRKSRRLAFSFV